MILPGKLVTQYFYVRNSQADATPTCVLIRVNIDTTVPVTVTAQSDGGWLASATIPSNWTEGEIVHMRISAVTQGLTVGNTVKLGTIGSPRQAVTYQV